LVSGLDILPTLCDFAGLQPPPKARGFSARQIIDRPAAPWREAVFGALGADQGRMACTGRYKYNLYAGNKEELFDLQTDPLEMKNLVASPALQLVRARHRELLREWMEKTGDSFTKPDGLAKP
jgi:arylsulfatase A-like enzyme